MVATYEVEIGDRNILRVTYDVNVLACCGIVFSFRYYVIRQVRKQQARTGEEIDDRFGGW